VASSFNNSYDYPLMALIGSITQVDAQYNYKRDGSTFAQGAPLPRKFATDSYEFYAQDSWKVKSNLTIIYGLRYSLFSPPWETGGLEVTPTMSLGSWFNVRGQHQSQGIGAWADPTVSFNLAGPANGGKPGFYNWDYKNFGPRIGVAWSPGATGGLLGSLFGGPGKSSIRAGFGIVYDRIGQGLLATFDRRGAFGMSTTLTNQAAIETMASAPRVNALAGFNAIPQKDANGSVIFAPAPCGAVPADIPRPEPGWRLRGYVRARQFDQDPLFVYDGPLVRPRACAWIRFGSLLRGETLSSAVVPVRFGSAARPGGPKVRISTITRRYKPWPKCIGRARHHRPSHLP